MDSDDTVIKPPIPTRDDDYESRNSIFPHRDRDRDRDDHQLESSAVEDEEKHVVIIKELRNVQRQNSITHYLLSAMIVITLGWQLSEVSLILKIKEGFSNPFKSLAAIIKGLLPNNQLVDAHAHAPAIDFETPSLPSLKLPDLSYLGLPFDSSDDDDD